MHVWAAEVVEYASSIAGEMRGDYVEHVSTGMDTYSIRQPLGVSYLMQSRTTGCLSATCDHGPYKAVRSRLLQVIRCQPDMYIKRQQEASTMQSGHQLHVARLHLCVTSTSSSSDILHGLAGLCWHLPLQFPSHGKPP